MANDQITRKRKWWIAGLLGFLVPGLGQVYNSQATKGLFYYFVLSTWGGLVFSMVYTVMKYPVTRLNLAVLSVLFLLSTTAYFLTLLEAIVTARKTGCGHVLQRYNRWYVYLVVIIAVSGVSRSVTLAFRDNVLKAYKIPSMSMQPALEPGDHVISNQLFYRYNNPGRGDLVIFKAPGDTEREYIKRIVGLPGDTVRVEAGRAYINGHLLDEPYAGSMTQEIDSKSGEKGDITLSGNEYFLLGDNRADSIDSRKFGPVKRHDIGGKAIFIYFSWDRTIPPWNIVGRILSIRVSRIGKIL